jgi:hypothetical protein
LVIEGMVHKKKKILLGFSYYQNPVDIKTWVDEWLGRLRLHGIDVDSFCLTLDPPAPRLTWSELDARWRRGDPKLLAMYKDLAGRLDNYDVFVNWNGINLHPQFVRHLPTFNVYGCFDDPESSNDLSRPVAWAYDLCMVGNAAEVDSYRRWGVEHTEFWPLGFREGDYDPSLTREKILRGQRDVDIALLCERTSPWRRQRLDKFTAAFPQGAYYGAGWPSGFLPEVDRISLLQRTKIGINIHNSSGPINFRTYYLPANGIMQVCDNRTHLSAVFELNKEIVGFDSIEEAIELCRYYLKHDEERRQIAAAGWERAVKNYSEVAVFQVLLNSVQKLHSQASRKKNEAVMLANRQQWKMFPFRVGFHTMSLVRRIIRKLIPKRTSQSSKIERLRETHIQREHEN